MRRAQAEVERRKIEGALREAGGDAGRASEVLGIPYRSLLAKLAELRLRNG